jgi:hypothetical protein
MATTARHRNLDDVVMQALLTHDEGEIAATTRFVRPSMPYEDVEVDFEPPPSAPVRRRRPRTFVKTVRARETDRDIVVPSLSAASTVRLEAKWFASSEDSLSRMLAAEQERRKRQWLWLMISVVVATVATIALSVS